MKEMVSDGGVWAAGPGGMCVEWGGGEEGRRIAKGCKLKEEKVKKKVELEICPCVLCVGASFGLISFLCFALGSCSCLSL